MNKTESRVELRWDIGTSVCINEEQKKLIRKRLATRFTEQGELILTCNTHRSQHRNREEVTERFLNLIISGVKPLKKRKPTKPSRSSVEKRIRDKKIRGEVKRSRRNNPEE